MIVVIGTIELGRTASGARPVGMAGAIALAAAGAGARVEAITKVGDDPAGDELLIALARAGVGHVAVLRDAAHATPVQDADPTGDTDDAATVIDALLEDVPVAVVGTGFGAPSIDAPSLEPADVQLALRYVTDYRVIVAVRPSPDVVAEAIAAAGWAGAHLLLVTAPAAIDAAATPPGSLVVEVAADDDGSGGLADRLGRYAAAVDGGTPAEDAYGALVEVGAP